MLSAILNMIFGPFKVFHTIFRTSHGLLYGLMWKPFIEEVMKARKRQGPTIYDESLANSYEYDLLEAPGRVRLLSLWPGQEWEPIKCDITQWSLDTWYIRYYEALSYAWGDVNKKKTIWCSGRKLEITESLYIALLHLRSRSKMRLLWIDAVCINQHNLTELSQQVRMMGEIYYNASSVLIWLGENNELSEKSFQCVQEVKSLFPPAWKLILYSRNPKRLRQVVVKSLIRGTIIDNLLGRRSITDYDMEPLIELFSRPWFQRKWVIQEFAKSQRAVGICGDKTIPWRDIVQLSFYLTLGEAAYLSHLYLSDKGRQAAQALQRVRSMAIIREVKEESKLSLLNLILFTRNFKASKPVDSISAVIGLAADVAPADVDILPDYTLKEEEVFKRLAIWGIFKRRNLGYLSLASKDPGTSTRLSLPSWVPDFSRLESCYPLTNADVIMYHAGGSTTPLARLNEDDTVLYLTGKIIDTVKDMAEVGPGEEFPPDSFSDIETSQIICRRISAWIKKCQTVAFGTATAMSEQEYDQFWRTLVCDNTGRGDRAPPEFRDSFGKFLEALEYEDGGKQDRAKILEQLDASQLIFPAINNHFGTRRFCITEHGRLGQMPKAAEIGDSLCVFKGALFRTNHQSAPLVNGLTH